jgi:hypothetical protein
MKTYIHGTSYESGMDMIINGINPEPDRIWECSNANYMYFREKPDSDEDEDSHEVEYECLCNGQIAAAYTDSKETYIAMLVLEMSDELADEIVEEDNSCENMYNCWQIDICDIKEGIDNGTIKAKVCMYANAYVPYLRPFYLSNIEKHMEIKDRLLNDAIRVIRNSDAFIDELFENDGIKGEFVLKSKRLLPCHTTKKIYCLKTDHYPSDDTLNSLRRLGYTICDKCVTKHN